MENYLDGFGRKEVTFNSTNNVCKGKTVKLINSNYVDIAEVGDIFVGVCTSAYDDLASILIRGYTKVKFTGTAPECGYVKLSADTEGGVKVDANGRYVLVTDVDDNENICGIVL